MDCDQPFSYHTIFEHYPEITRYQIGEINDKTQQIDGAPADGKVEPRRHHKLPPFDVKAISLKSEEGVMKFLF